MADKSEWEVSLEDDVTPQAHKAEGSLARLQRAFEKFNKSGVKRAVAKFASMAKDVIAIGAAAAAGVAGSITAMTVSMVDFNQRSTLAFERLAKHGEVPQELFQRSIDLAKQFGLDIQSTTKQIAKFRALQFNQGQAEALIKMGADMRSLGATTEEVSRIFAQLGQIQAKGKLQGEELIVLAENGLSTQLVYEHLQKQLGKTRAEILKMQQAGQITSSQALQAIGGAILQKTNTTQFGQAGQQAADATLSGFGGRLKASFDDAFRRAAVKAEPAIMAALQPIGDRLMVLFEDPRTADTIAKIVSAIGDAIQHATPFVEKFLSAFVDGFMAAWPGIQSGFETMLDLFGSIGGSGSTADTVARIGKAIGEIAAILAGTFVAAVGIAVVVINTLASWWNFLKGVAMSFAQALAPIVLAITDFFANLGAIFSAEGLSLGEKAIALGKAIINGVIKGLVALGQAPGNLLRGLASTWIDTAKSMLGIASPSTVFRDIGLNVGEGFNIGVDDSMPTVQGVAGTLGTSQGFSPMVGAGAAAGNTVNVSFSVNVPAGSDAQEIGQTISDTLERKLNEWIDGVAISQGV